MRYLALSLTLALSLFLNGVVFVQYPIFGIQPDFMLCCMVCMAFRERTLTPVFYFAAGGIVFDVLFSAGLGFYALQYLIVGILVYLFAAARGENDLRLVPIAGAAALLVKDILAYFLCLFLGRSMDFGRRFLTQTLPGALMAALLCFGLYFLFERLYSFRFMGTNADLPRKDEL